MFRRRHGLAEGLRPAMARAPTGRRAFLYPAKLSSRPAPARAIHGTSEFVGRDAAPPNPVAGAPVGMISLPAASTRSSSLISAGPSSTTIVWIVPAASVIVLLVRSVRPAALTFQLPG